MTFEAQIVAFADRFLSERTRQLIVLPAVADLQFEERAGALRHTANRLAVLKAVAGAIGDELSRAAGAILRLALMPACYYIFLMVILFDVHSITISTNFVVVSALVLVLSFGPVMVCFWPERTSPRPIE